MASKKAPGATCLNPKANSPEGDVHVELEFATMEEPRVTFLLVDSWAVNEIEKTEEYDQASEKKEDFEQDSNFSSPFYFKLLNPYFSVNQESSSEKEKIVSLEGVCGEYEEENFRAEGKMVDEEFCYEIELIPRSHSSSLDQESDAHREMEKNDSSNWMEMEPQSVKLSDDLDLNLELERQSDSSSSPSCADANSSSQQKCWDSDHENEDVDDGGDVLFQLQNWVYQMKMVPKSCRIRGLPTISEDSETPEMIEDLRPLEIDHKIGFKEVIDGIQRFYKSYTNEMRKRDILNYRASHAAICFLQLKETKPFTAGKTRADFGLPRFLAGKGRRDLEVVYNVRKSAIRELSFEHVEGSITLSLREVSHPASLRRTSVTYGANANANDKQ
ncbi:hypothetical protein SASPL_119774 [Salvia splendens]|uniref:Uncharacterized protein n=1 Tax=Salvia splendens TaxID=180675 RepID=A0A8X8XT04_SALSN|nr:hypothetical protein SASPL_119774 [Salvia splendens]